MSMELIDKKKLIEKVKTFHKWSIHTDNFPMIPSKRDNVGYLADDVLFGIDLEPTVQAVSIEVLDKIRAELLATAEMHEDGNYYLRDKWVSEIIDKYKQGG